MSLATDEKPLNLSEDTLGRRDQVLRIQKQLEEEGQALRERLVALHEAEHEFQAQSAVRFDATQDDAFEHLLEVTKQVVTIPSGEFSLRRRSPALLSIVGATERKFKALSEVAEDIVDEYGRESRRYIELEDATENYIKKVITWSETFLLENDAAQKIRASAVQDHKDKQTQLELAYRTLFSARNKRNDFFYEIFGDRDIDDQISNAEKNVDSHENNRRNTKSRLERLESLCSVEEQVLKCLGVLRTSAEASLSLAHSNFERLNDMKRVSNQTWSSIRKLSFHVESPDYQATRDSCLRHILDLTHTQFAVIDADVDVQNAKRGIDDEIRRVLGDTAWKELEESRSALPESEL